MKNLFLLSLLTTLINPYPAEAACELLNKKGTKTYYFSDGTRATVDDVVQCATGVNVSPLPEKYQEEMAVNKHKKELAKIKGASGSGKTRYFGTGN